jgi:hypothetical protein
LSPLATILDGFHVLQVGHAVENDPQRRATNWGSLDVSAPSLL